MCERLRLNPSLGVWALPPHWKTEIDYSCLEAPRPTMTADGRYCRNVWEEIIQPVKFDTERSDEHILAVQPRAACIATLPLLIKPMSEDDLPNVFPYTSREVEVINGRTYYVYKR